MAVASHLPDNQESKMRKKQKKDKKNTNHKNPPPPAPSPPPSSPPAKPSPSVSAAAAHQSSWEQLKSLVTCKFAVDALDPPLSSKHAKLMSSCGFSICAVRDVVVLGNTRVVSRSSDSGGSSPGDSRRSEAATVPKHTPAAGGGGLPLLRFSGCYECRAIAVDPVSRRYPRPRTMSPCSECSEVFTKPESLEMHRVLRHAVSELGPDDSGRNIVEIIFKSSWQKKDGAMVRIERILKVHNAPRTISRFEDYRAAVKSRAAARHHHHHRCAADGNELLRFHSAPISCRLGAGGSSALCAGCCSPAADNGAAACGACAVIRSGFPREPRGVRTTASSGGAHGGGGADTAAGDAARAMLVCRVIAGRVRRPGEDPAAEEDGGAAAYDSVAGGGDGGQFADLEELFVANPRAILPCFVVIYRVLELS